MTVKKNFSAMFVVFTALVFLGFSYLGCAQGKPSVDSKNQDGSEEASAGEGLPPPTIYPHPDEGWSDPASHGLMALQVGTDSCLSCHPVGVKSGGHQVACNKCHTLFPHGKTWVQKSLHGAFVLQNGKNSCATACHGTDLEGGLSKISCHQCHTLYPHVSDWKDPGQHGESAKGFNIGQCKSCHGSDLLGGESKISCHQCHASYPHAEGWKNPDKHGDHVTQNGVTNCATRCHGEDFAGGLSQVSCNTCHNLFPHSESWQEEHGATAQQLGFETCQGCHEAPDDGSVSFCNTCHADFPHPSPEKWVPYQGGHGAKINTTYGGSLESCQTCHGTDFSEIKNGQNCFSCHTSFPHPENWQTFEGHGAYTLQNSKVSCQLCHGEDYEGGDRGNPSCYQCHTTYPHQEGWGNPTYNHADYVTENSSASCATERCHGINLQPTPGVTKGPNCQTCHVTYPHEENWNVGLNHGPTALADIDQCKICHGASLNEVPSVPEGLQSCQDCHQSYVRHETAALGVPGWSWRHGLVVRTIYDRDMTECQLCHGSDYLGGVSNVSCKNCHESFPHSENWATPAGAHGPYVQTELNGNTTDCQLCHGVNLKGGTSEVSCFSCHESYPHPSIGEWLPFSGHGSHVLNDLGGSTEGCKLCHGEDLTGGNTGFSCFACHSTFPHAEGWATLSGHGTYVRTTLGGNTNSCKLCHGNDLTGGTSGVSCFSCHESYPHPSMGEWLPFSGHGSHVLNDLGGSTEGCKLCHGEDLTGGNTGFSCFACHQSFPHGENWGTFEGHGSHVQTELSGNTNSCNLCHGGDLTGGSSGVSCFSCHESYPHAGDWSNPTTGHGNYVMDQLNGNTASCESCHGENLTGGNAGVSCFACHSNYPHTDPAWLSLSPANHGGSHGPAAYGSGKDSCDSANCHGANFAGNPPTVPGCTGCHAQYPHENFNDHPETFIQQIQNGNTYTCTKCHGSDYGREVNGATCLGCHPNGVTHRANWATGTGHGFYFSANYDSSSNVNCDNCHGEMVVFNDGQTFNNLQSTANPDDPPRCYECHWAYPHKGYDAGSGAVDWLPPINGAHALYLIRSPLLVNDADPPYHPNPTNNGDPQVVPAIQNTCGGGTINLCHFGGKQSNGQPTQDFNYSLNLCGGYCHQ